MTWTLAQQPGGPGQLVMPPVRPLLDLGSPIPGTHAALHRRAVRDDAAELATHMPPKAAPPAMIANMSLASPAAASNAGGMSARGTAFLFVPAADVENHQKEDVGERGERPAKPDPRLRVR